jgi:hypothetical protein
LIGGIVVERPRNLPQPITPKDRAKHTDPEHDMGLICVTTSPATAVAYKKNAQERLGAKWAKEIETAQLVPV